MKKKIIPVIIFAIIIMIVSIIAETKFPIKRTSMKVGS
jgi:hypothetical protein